MEPNTDHQPRQRIAAGTLPRVRLAYSGHTGPTRVLYFATPEGNRIVSAAVDATIRVWDTEAKREVGKSKSAQVPQGRMVAVVVSGGKRLLWCGDDKWVHITDIEAGKDFQLASTFAAVTPTCM